MLNFSYMTLDAYPAGVPEKYRLDNSFIDAFYGEGADQIAQKHADIQFRDRAAEMGIALNDTGRGVAVEDFDQDGDLDIVTGGAFHDVRFFRNDFQNSGGFLDHTDETGLKDVRQPFFISSADYDNDGFVDLLVARPFATSRLFRNENGVFRDVTEETGLFAGKDPDAITPTWNIAWGDVDLDGDLDLFLAHWGMAIPFVSGLLAKPRLSSMLYINEGGRFTDQTRTFGLHDVVHDAYFIGATFGDYDGDRYPDLLISSPLRKTTILMRNLNGKGFKDSGLVHFPESGFTSAFVDVNHDGRLDIFRAGFGDAQTNTAQIVFREKLDLIAGRSTIMLQTEDGRFEPHDEFFGGDFPVSTMGASFGDLNMDGCHDFYLGSGNPEPWFILPNMMYLGQNNGSDCTGAMTNISMLNGFGTIQKGHGIVFFDFDEDGDQDIYSALGGMWPADAWPNQFFVNEGENANSWIKLRLRGRRTNYYGVGAKITVHASNASGEPIVRTWHMDNKTGFGSAPYIAHIGLYDATSIDRIEVDWPVSGCKGVYQAELGGPGSQPILLDEASCLQTAQESRDSSNKTSAGGR